MKYSGFEYELDFDLEESSESVSAIVVYEKIDKLLVKFMKDIMTVAPIKDFKLTKNLKEIREGND